MSINREKLGTYLNISGDALRRLATYQEEAGQAATVVAATVMLADEADNLLEKVENNEDIEGEV